MKDYYHTDDYGFDIFYAAQWIKNLLLIFFAPRWRMNMADVLTPRGARKWMERNGVHGGYGIFGGNINYRERFLKMFMCISVMQDILGCLIQY